MSKGILKRQESPEATVSSTPDSCSKHVKWDEEKLKVSEAIKMTIPKGQIDEPKTPFQHGQTGQNCDEDGEDVFNLKSVGSETCEDRRSSISQSENESLTGTSWESSMSEFETDEDGESREKREKFVSMRAQHYFMKQSLQRGKNLMESDDDDDEDEEEKLQKE